MTGPLDAGFLLTKMDDMKTIQERVRAQLAKAERDRKAAEYKAGESARRSTAARIAADVRKDNRLYAVLEGRAEPKTRAEIDALMRLESDFED